MVNKKKTHRLNIRLTDDEWIIINNLAQRTGMTITQLVIKAVLECRITINEIDANQILKPLLGLQRHYNTIRNWMIKNDNSLPVLEDSYIQELDDLWQLLAQAKAPIAQRDL